MPLDLKRDFSLFLNAAPDRLHFAAHSHHYWPDVTFEAHKQYWLDAAQYADLKWPRIFEKLLPDVRQGIANILKLPDPGTICVAPTTHEFVMRLLSCFPAGKPIRVLTTDSEFYSFRRQIGRMAEDQLVDVTEIATAPFSSFAERFMQACAEQDYDLVFMSQVFFNSGFEATPLEKIVASVKDPETFVVIDGYHGFMAVPTDLSSIHARAFYLGGGYKYAMSGEGACFMHCPADYAPRPVNTGWFAEMDSLAAQKTGAVDYAKDGMRFAGATLDTAGLYRLRAVFEWMQSRQITVESIHDHAHRLQKSFVEALPAGAALSAEDLVVPMTEAHRGNFLTFQTSKAGALAKQLLEQHHIVTDYRGDRLRFGFAPYHDKADVEKLTKAVCSIHAQAA